MSEKLTKAFWFARWQLARWMVHAALVIAPRGPARTLLVDYLNAYGREVVAALEKTS